MVKIETRTYETIDRKYFNDQTEIKEQKITTILEFKIYDYYFTSNNLYDQTDSNINFELNNIKIMNFSYQDTYIFIALLVETDQQLELSDIQRIITETQVIIEQIGYSNPLKLLKYLETEGKLE